MKTPTLDELKALAATLRPLPERVLHTGPGTVLPFPKLDPAPPASFLWGIPVQVDPALAPGTAELRGEDGQVLCRLTDLLTDAFVTRYRWQVGLAVTTEDLQRWHLRLPVVLP
jgi:hypothetical protein